MGDQQTSTRPDAASDRHGRAERRLDPRWVRLQSLVAAGFPIAGVAVMILSAALIPPLAAMGGLFLVGLALARRRPRAGAIAVGVLAALNLAFDMATVGVLLGYLSRPQEPVLFLLNLALPLLALAGTVGLVGSVRRGRGQVADRTVQALVAVLTAATAIALGAWMLDGGTATVDATAQDTATVAVLDNRFAPAVLTVTAGTTVEWVWDARIDHDVVADGFASDVQTAGAFAHRFDTPGDHMYRCSLHPGMAGTITVVAADGGE